MMLGYSSTFDKGRLSNSEYENPLARSFKEQLNDPSSHFERNIKKYNYSGAASTQGFNLEVGDAKDNLGHQRKPLGILEMELQ